MSSELAPDSNPIEALLLTAYPNPDRCGCLSHDELLRMGKLRVSADHPSWNHVWHCSPCFAKFKSFRDQRWQQETLRQKKRRYFAASTACLAILGVLMTATLQTRRVGSAPSSNPKAASVKLDLSNFEVVRGFSSDIVRPSFTLPRRLDELEVQMPRSAHPGPYKFALLNSSTLSAAVTGSVEVEEIRNTSLAKVHLDLSHLARGEYNMSFHGGRPVVDFSVLVKVE